MIRRHYPFNAIDNKYAEMQFRRSVAPPAQYEWVKDMRNDLYEAADAIQDMLNGQKGTIKKDRRALAQTFDGLRRVLENKSLKGTHWIQPDVETKK